MVTYRVTPGLVLVRVLEGEEDLLASGDANLPGDRLALVVTKVDAIKLAISLRFNIRAGRHLHDLFARVIVGDNQEVVRRNASVPRYVDILALLRREITQHESQTRRERESNLPE